MPSIDPTEEIEGSISLTWDGRSKFEAYDAWPFSELMIFIT